ncbi:hypothetical protein B0H16DRAFT_1462215 [Mycena metata]|uniref:Uncharacterized protein n=1 Tax=Mycena metata TaxID=1033252 RepID=A0AAD7N5Y7_9AGAR|nr:hypothetical protein B0H16DRAFT_1462215 [Mycena metata]
MLRAMLPSYSDWTREISGGGIWERKRGRRKGVSGMTRVKDESTVRVLASKTEAMVETGNTTAAMSAATSRRINQPSEVMLLETVVYFGEPGNTRNASANFSQRVGGGDLMQLGHSYQISAHGERLDDEGTVNLAYDRAFSIKTKTQGESPQTQEKSNEDTYFKRMIAKYSNIDRSGRPLGEFVPSNNPFPGSSNCIPRKMDARIIERSNFFFGQSSALSSVSVKCGNQPVDGQNLMWIMSFRGEDKSDGSAQVSLSSPSLSRILTPSSGSPPTRQPYRLRGWGMFRRNLRCSLRASDDWWGALGLRSSRVAAFRTMVLTLPTAQRLKDSEWEEGYYRGGRAAYLPFADPPLPYVQ